MFKFGAILAHHSPKYSQIALCGHPAITDTPIKGTVAKSRAKTNYGCLTEIYSRYDGLLRANEDTNSRSLQCPPQRELTVFFRKALRNKQAWMKI